MDGQHVLKNSRLSHVIGRRDAMMERTKKMYDLFKLVSFFTICFVKAGGGFFWCFFFLLVSLTVNLVEVLR